MNVCSKVTAPPEHKIHDESAAVESTLQFSNTSELTSEAVHYPNSTSTNSIGQLVVTRDDLQGNDKIAMTFMGSASDAADEQTDDISDCGEQFSHASRPAVKSVGFEVEIENGAVKQNCNSFDVASAHHTAEINTTEHQNLDVLLGLKVASKVAVSHDLEVVSQMSLDANVIKDQDSPHVPIIGCICKSGERKLEIHRVKSEHAISDNVSIASGDMNQATAESFRARMLCKTSNTCSSSVDNAFPSATQRGQNVENFFCAVLSVDSNIDSSCQTNGLDAHKAISPINTESRSSRGSLSDAPRKPDFPTCTSDGVCLSRDEITTCKATVDDGPNANVISVSLDRNEVTDAFQMSTESLEQPKSDSQVHQAGVTNCSTETVHNSSSGSGVALHCSSGGGNSCGTAEVIILSNQAS